MILEQSYNGGKMLYEDKKIDSIPVGPLGLIPLKGMEDFTKKVNN